jgi:hypothetical protein
VGITATTPDNLVIGAGDVKVDTADVGATEGDNVFRIEQDIFTPDDLNGIPGTLLGTHYKITEDGILEASMPEVSAANLALVWPGSRSTTTSGTTTIDSTNARRFASTAFHDYELRVDGLTKSFKFQIDNGLNRGTAEFTATNAGLMAARVEVHSAWDPAALTASPHRIITAALV